MHLNSGNIDAGVSGDTSLWFRFLHKKNIGLTICHDVFPSQRNVSAKYFNPNWTLDVINDASSGLACLAMPSYWYEYSLCH